MREYKIISAKSGKTGKRQDEMEVSYGNGGLI